MSKKSKFLVAVIAVGTFIFISTSIWLYFKSRNIVSEFKKIESELNHTLSKYDSIKRPQISDRANKLINIADSIKHVFYQELKNHKGENITLNEKCLSILKDSIKSYSIYCSKEFKIVPKNILNTNNQYSISDDKIISWEEMYFKSAPAAVVISEIEILKNEIRNTEIETTKIRSK